MFSNVSNLKADLHQPAKILQLGSNCKSVKTGSEEITVTLTVHLNGLVQVQTGSRYAVGFRTRFLKLLIYVLHSALKKMFQKNTTLTDCLTHRLSWLGKLTEYQQYT